MACLESEKLIQAIIPKPNLANKCTLRAIVRVLCTTLLVTTSSNCLAEFTLDFTPANDKYIAKGKSWMTLVPTDTWIYPFEDVNNTPDNPYDDRPGRWDNRFTRWVDYANISFGEAGTRLYNQSDMVVQQYTGGLETPELVTDPSNGKQYWHVLITDEFNGFKQDVYIETAAGVEYGVDPSGNHHLNRSHTIITEDKDYGYYNLPGSASGGGINDYALIGNNQYAGGNQSRVFSAGAGNGTGDPRKVIIRQIVDDGEIRMEYLKDKYDKKALITQVIKNGEIDMNFELDMRALDYTSNQTTPGTVINTVNLLGAHAPGEEGDYDGSLKKFQDKVYVSGGMYHYIEPLPGTYSPQEGTADGAAGTYVYANGDSAFDHYSIAWANYLDPASFDGAYVETKDANGNTQLTYYYGVSTDDRVDIKGNGWEFQGWGATQSFIQKTDEVSTYGYSQGDKPIVNPWSYSQADFCDVSPEC